MNAVVFAYHDMGCTGTLALLEAGYDIAAIFTHPDNAAENHFFGSVARIAAERGIPRLHVGDPGIEPRHEQNEEDVVHLVENLFHFFNLAKFC